MTQYNQNAEQKSTEDVVSLLNERAKRNGYAGDSVGKEKSQDVRPEKAQPIPNVWGIVDIANRFLAWNTTPIAYTAEFKNPWSIFNGSHWEEDASRRYKGLIRKHLETERRNAFEEFEKVIKKAKAKKQLTKDRDNLLRRLQDTTTVNKIAETLSEHHSIAVVREKWDKQYHLLATPNGTYNLDSGETLEPDPKHYIRQCTIARLGGNWHEAKKWLEVVCNMFDHDWELVFTYVKFFGRSLRAKAEGREMGCVFGESGTGKSKTIECLVDSVVGHQYWRTANRDLITTSMRNQECLSVFDGARLVYKAEMQGQKLDQQAFKDYTGGSHISFDGKYDKERTVEVCAKLVGDGNGPFEFDVMENALLQRLLFFPTFNAIPEGEQDQTLPAQMAKERDALLDLLIIGERLYREGGEVTLPNGETLTLTARFKDIPPIMDTSKREFFEKQDKVAAWLESNVITEGLKSNQTVSASELWEDFESSLQPKERNNWTQRTLTHNLKGRGFQDCKRNGYTHFRFMKLRKEENNF